MSSPSNEKPGEDKAEGPVSPLENAGVDPNVQNAWFLYERRQHKLSVSPPSRRLELLDKMHITPIEIAFLVLCINKTDPRQQPGTITVKLDRVSVSSDIAEDSLADFFGSQERLTKVVLLSPKTTLDDKTSKVLTLFLGAVGRKEAKLNMLVAETTLFGTEIGQLIGSLAINNVELAACAIDNSFVEGLSSITKPPKFLGLADCGLTDGMMSTLAHDSAWEENSLVGLSISQNGDLTPDSLPALAGLLGSHQLSLQRLALSTNSHLFGEFGDPQRLVNAEGGIEGIPFWDALKGFKALEVLCLSGFSIHRGLGRVIQDLILAQTWPNLKKLDLSKREMFRDIPNGNSGPFQIVVENAGAEEVNGVYNQAGYFEGTCQYRRSGRWRNRNVDFAISKSLVHGMHQWQVSIPPRGELPSSSFYRAPEIIDCTDTPPKEGWVNGPHGCYPVPEFRMLEGGADPMTYVRSAFEWIAAAKNLTHLKLQTCELNSIACVGLFQALELTGTIESLNLDGNRLEVCGWEQSLPSLRQLHELFMDELHPKEREWAVLEKVLSTTESVTRFDFGLDMSRKNQAKCTSILSRNRGVRFARRALKRTELLAHRASWPGTLKRLLVGEACHGHENVSAAYLFVQKVGWQ